MENNLFGLWPHQEEAVSKIENAWSKGINSICYQLATGSGKTRIIRTIVDNHRMSKKIIYIIVHRKQLVKQISEELEEAGIKHGIIQANSPYLKYRVQVCSIQTLIRRLDKLPEPEIIIQDEFHHCKSETNKKIYEHWNNAKILGVTATPRRTDGKPLKDICEILFCGPQTKDLINDKYLSGFEYFAPDDIDMSGVHKRMGEFIASEYISKVDNKQIIGSIVKHYREYADHKPTIACCVNIAHAEHIAEQFKFAGYNARAIHSKMNENYIEESIKGLRNNTIEILCQVDLLGEGVDIKGAECLIMARPTGSEIICLQQFGRVLRKSKGKEKAIILDHVNNWERHGCPDDYREWSLDGIIKEKEKSKYKRCPECLHPVPVKTKICPFCGKIWSYEPVMQELPKEVEGKLINIKDKRERNSLVIDIARGANNLKQAIAIAKNHGASHKQAWYIWTHELRNKGA